MTDDNQPVYAYTIEPGSMRPTRLAVDPAKRLLPQVNAQLTRDGKEQGMDLCTTSRWPELMFAVDEWGSDGTMPVNGWAWLVYGRSPIFGRAILFADSNGAGMPQPIPAALAEEIEAKMPQDALDALTRALARMT